MHKQKLVKAISRLSDLIETTANSNAGIEVYKGMFLALTLFYEEFSGRSLALNTVSPQDVMEWARRVKRTGEI